MTYFLKVKLLGWPSEGPMVLPLILSLRFLIKEKEKKLFHKTFKTFFLLLSLTVGNMPTGGAAATAAAFILSVACATRWQDFSATGNPSSVKKKKLT